MRAKNILMAIVIVFLVGCTTNFQSRPILPAAGQTELSITATGAFDNSGKVIFTVSGDQTITFSDEDDRWYYDVPEDKQEYALIETLSDQIWYVHIHLHESKRPK